MTDPMATSMADQTAEPVVLGYVNEPSHSGTRIVGIRLSEKDACSPHMHTIIDELKRRWEGYLARCAEVDAVAASIGSTRFLDPPDGGDVPIAEQVNRMRQALEASEARCAALVKVLEDVRSYLHQIDGSPREIRLISEALKEQNMSEPMPKNTGDQSCVLCGGKPYDVGYDQITCFDTASCAAHERMIPRAFWNAAMSRTAAPEGLREERAIDHIYAALRGRLIEPGDEVRQMVAREIYAALALAPAPGEGK